MTARNAPILVLATLLAIGASNASAQQAQPAQPVPSLPAPNAAATTAETKDAQGAPLVEDVKPGKTKDAKVEVLVTEDSQVRIEETRVRGVTKKIVVHSKIPGVGSYEIQPKDPSVDPEHDQGAGMRLFSFGF
jgi:hypothetical protein